MSALLHILHLEDDPGDVALVQSTLEEEGIDCAVLAVETREEFVAALEVGGIDLILSDFSLPSFDGNSAIQIAQADWPGLPVILVSGTVGEEEAIESLKNGATDYVLKGRLSRLVPAVKRAMREVEERKERKQMEAKFIEAQKMELMGQLAGGVAHDFNNILSVIMGYSDMIRSKLDKDSPLRDYLEEIGLASERAVGLTRQLLIFSRKETVQSIVLDLNAVMDEVYEMLHRLVDENIKIVMLPGSDLGHINADAGYVGQVLMNLVVNARDAMPNGGRLTISTANATLDDEYVQAHPRATAGDYVKLSVADTGAGIAPEVMKHLFEAFFTTKPKGKGTGLGLATCQTIVHQAGGHIDVESAPGLGTTFNIYFPRVEQELESVSRPFDALPLPRGAEAVLVVEDDPSVRQLAQGVLAAQGYEVLSAANGQEALRVAHEHKGTPIRLVITDVIMPLMGGKVMSEWLKASFENLKVLYTSGYTDDTIANAGVMEEGMEFMPKPYTPAILARKVREILDR